MYLGVPAYQRSGYTLILHRHYSQAGTASIPNPVLKVSNGFLFCKTGTSTPPAAYSRWIGRTLAAAMGLF